MRAPVRAKFRVLKITQDYNGTWTADMRPIQRGRGKDPENDLFWDATPSGEAALQFAEKPDLKVGDYYYMDLIPDDDGDVLLASLEFHRGGQISVWFTRSHNVPHPVWPENDRRLWMYDTLKMGVGGGDRFDLRDNMKAHFGLPDDGQWRLEVTWAEASDDCQN